MISARTPSAHRGKYHRMGKDRKFLNQHFSEMCIGQRIVIHRRVFESAYPCGWPSIYNTHEQAFLSSMIGSAWGAWRCERDWYTGNYVVSRNEVSDKRHYVDPDREHLFDRMPDGTLELKVSRAETPKVD